MDINLFSCFLHSSQTNTFKSNFKAHSISFLKASWLTTSLPKLALIWLNESSSNFILPQLTHTEDSFSRGKKWIQEKTKEIRQAFSKAVVSGPRSGSGKIVFEHYDNLLLIWGGLANSNPLPFGISSSEKLTLNNIENVISDHEDISDCSDNENELKQKKKEKHL